MSTQSSSLLSEVRHFGEDPTISAALAAKDVQGDAYVNAADPAEGDEESRSRNDKSQDDSLRDAQCARQTRKEFDLLLFVDPACPSVEVDSVASVATPSVSVATGPRRGAWEVLSPPSYAKWAYRCFPRRPQRLDPCHGASHGGRDSGSVNKGGKRASPPLVARRPRPQHHHRQRQLWPSSGNTTPGTAPLSTRSTTPQRFKKNVPKRPQSQQQSLEPRRDDQLSRSPSPATSCFRAQTRTPTTRASSSASGNLADEMHALSVLSHCQKSVARYPPPSIHSPYRSQSPLPSAGVPALFAEAALGCPELDAHYNVARAALSDQQHRELHSRFAESNLTSMVSDSLVCHNNIAAAAEAAAVQASAIGVAIRAKAICRFAASAACRHLVSQEEEEGEVDGPDDSYPEEFEPERRLSKHGLEVLDEGDGGEGEFWNDSLQSFQSDHSSRPEPYPNYLRRSPVKVACNTTLGRMVRQDPDRAAKYNVVAVPAHKFNVPWPPPPLPKKAREFVLPPKLERIIVQDTAESTPSPNKEPPEPVQNSSDELLKDFVKGQNRNSTMIFGKRKSARKMKGWGPLKSGTALISSMKDLERKQLIHDFELANPIPQEHEIDFTVAEILLDDMEREQYETTYYHFSNTSSGKLGRVGMQRAMYEVGLTAQTVQDLVKLKNLQLQVIQYCRGDDSYDMMNPLTDKRGLWELKEFLLMIAGDMYLRRKHQLTCNQAIAAEHGISLAEVNKLLNNFTKFDVDGNGGISMWELRRLLKFVDLDPLEEDLRILLKAIGLGDKEEFDFPDYVRVACKIEEFLQPGGGGSMILSSDF